MLAGDGRDYLFGFGGGDLMIAGPTDFDQDRDALFAIQREWVSDRTYDERVQNLSGSGTGDRSNGDVFLQDGTTLFDDIDRDILFGQGGQDWYFYDLSRDRAIGVTSDEIVGNPS